MPSPCTVIILPGILTTNENTRMSGLYSRQHEWHRPRVCAPDRRHECNISDTSACREYQPTNPVFESFGKRPGRVSMNAYACLCCILVECKRCDTRIGVLSAVTRVTKTPESHFLLYVLFIRSRSCHGSMSEFVGTVCLTQGHRPTQTHRSARAAAGIFVDQNH